MKLKTENGNRIRAMIIDDEMDGCDLLKGLLKKIRNVEVVDIANDSDHGIEKVLFYKPDLLFLDIKMPGKDGFQVIEELNKFHFNPAVIFITAYDQYAIKAIKAAAIDYLLKPVALKDLKEAIRRFMGSDHFKKDEDKHEIITETGAETIKINTRTGFHVIRANEIILIEAEGNYSTITLASNKKIIATINIGKLLSELPAYILRINRGLAVNSKTITEVDRKRKLCKITYGGVEQSFNISHEHIKEIDRIFK